MNDVDWTPIVSTVVLIAIAWAALWPEPPCRHRWSTRTRTERGRRVREQECRRCGESRVLDEDEL